MKMQNLPWRQAVFSKQVAWSEAGRQVSYAELCQDLDRRKSKHERSCRVLESDCLYECALAYLAAWEEQVPLCLMPPKWPETWKKSVTQRLEKFVAEISDPIFYFLPTSGTTSEPKLVAASFANWQSLMSSLTEFYSWNAGTQVALCFEPQFDPFPAIVFLALSQGATLVPLLSKDRFNIFEFIEKNKIEIWASVPSLVSLNWSRKLEGEAACLNLSIFTGEVLLSSLAEKWQKYAPNSAIENLYGPVETTVWVSRHRLNNVESTSIPIGVPFKSVQAEIWDGELVIRGPQVTLGYLNETGLQRFSGTYHTGDLVVESDGSLQLIGRKDSQIKLRGQRIELELIENLFHALTQQVGICGVDKNGNLFLVTEGNFDLEAVSRTLRDELPASHWPRHFYTNFDFGKTASGKINRGEVQKKIASGEINPSAMKDTKVNS